MRGTPWHIVDFLNKIKSIPKDFEVLDKVNEKIVK